MRLDEVQKILDKLAGTRSDYEFKNMVLEQQCSFPRRVEAALREKERIMAALQEAQIKIALDKYRTSTITDEIERSLVERLNVAKNIPLQREIIDLEGDLSQIDEWLNGISEQDLRTIPEDYEQCEREHWTTTLSRTNAIDILIKDNPSHETMSMLSYLPVEDFRKAVQLTVQFATFIRDTTMRAEEQLMASMAPQVIETPTKAKKSK